MIIAWLVKETRSLHILKLYVKGVWSNGEDCSRNSAHGDKKVKEHQQTLRFLEQECDSICDHNNHIDTVIMCVCTTQTVTTAV